MLAYILLLLLLLLSYKIMIHFFIPPVTIFIDKKY